MAGPSPAHYCRCPGCDSTFGLDEPARLIACPYCEQVWPAEEIPVVAAPQLKPNWFAIGGAMAVANDLFD